MRDVIPSPVRPCVADDPYERVAHLFLCLWGGGGGAGVSERAGGALRRSEHRADSPLAGACDRTQGERRDVIPSAARPCVADDPYERVAYLFLCLGGGGGGQGGSGLSFYTV